MTKKKWVSDLIGNEYLNWNKEDIITIGYSTGLGKSHFIRNELLKYANLKKYRILFLFNRKILKEQNNYYINNACFLDIMTYQTIEQKIRSGKDFCFGRWDVIVCDEAHYFISDSGFNDYSELSLEAILKVKNKIKIFISATGKTLFDYIKTLKSYNNFYQYPKQYKLNKNNFKQINKIMFYDNEESLDYIINKNYSQPETKIVHFVNDIVIGYNLYKKNEKNAYFMCGSNVKLKYKKYSKNIIFQDKNGNMTFDKKFLYATSVIDNGIDLKDRNIKLIVCDIFDFNTMIQCIGRKRFIDGWDKIDIIFKNCSNSQVQGFKRVKSKIIDEANLFMNEGIENWIKKVGKFNKLSNYIVYDEPSENGNYQSNKKISKVKYLKTKNDLTILESIIKIGKQSSTNNITWYQNYLTEYFNFSNKQVTNLSKNKMTLEQYLNSIVDKPMLTLVDREPLIERIGCKNNKGKLLKHKETLNCALHEQGYKYLIIDFKTSRMINGQRKTYQKAWKVIKLEE